jgi:hypothetical protein
MISSVKAAISQIVIRVQALSHVLNVQKGMVLLLARIMDHTVQVAQYHSVQHA